MQDRDANYAVSIAVQRPPDSRIYSFYITCAISLTLAVFGGMGIVPVWVPWIGYASIVFSSVRIASWTLGRNRRALPKRLILLSLSLGLAIIGLAASAVITFINLGFTWMPTTPGLIDKALAVILGVVISTELVLLLVPVLLSTLKDEHDSVVSTYSLDMLAMAGALLLLAFPFMEAAPTVSWLVSGNGYYISLFLLVLSSLVLAAFATLASRAGKASYFSYSLLVLSIIVALTMMYYALDGTYPLVKYLPDPFVVWIICLGIVLLNPVDPSEGHAIYQGGITQHINRWFYFVVLFTIPGAAPFIAAIFGLKTSVFVGFAMTILVAIIFTTRITYTLWKESQQLILVERVTNELRELVYKDRLTGLPNRAELIRILDEEETERPMLLVYLNLNRFKMVNDMAGHAVGDEVLKLVKTRLESFMAERDGQVFHMGADEFTVLTVYGDEKTAFDLGHLLRREFEPPFYAGKRQWYLGARIGMATRQSSAHLDAMSLIRNADTAMDLKGHGTSVNMFDAGMVDTITELHSKENALRSAIDRGMVLPVYQPIVNFVDGTIAGFETLARWKQADGHLLTAGAFIEVAEACGLDRPIDAIMLAGACDFISHFNYGLPADECAWITVNVSPQDLIGGDVAERISDNIKRTGIKPEWLVVELTESALETDGDYATNLIMDIHNLGVGLAIDDFGTGYSSLGHLMNFPVDILKVDKSFINNVAVVDEAKPEENSKMARAILTITNTLGFPALAEGIETPDQAKVLIDMGYPLAQGFMYSRPLVGIDALALRGAHLGVQPANA